MFPILRAMDKVHPRPLAWGGPWGGPAGNWREGEGRSMACIPQPLLRLHNSSPSLQARAAADQPRVPGEEAIPWGP